MRVFHVILARLVLYSGSSLAQSHEAEIDRILAKWDTSNSPGATVAWYMGSITFQGQADNSISGFLVSGERVRNLIFSKTD